MSPLIYQHDYQRPFLSVFFYPNTSVVEICSVDNLTLTCVTDTGTLLWYRGEYNNIFSTVLMVSNDGQLGDYIRVYEINVSGSVITSVANITRAPLALNGTVIQCRDSGDDEASGKEKALLMSGKYT